MLRIFYVPCRLTLLNEMPWKESYSTDSEAAKMDGKMLKTPEQALEPYLEDDEKLVWAGRPRQGVVFRDIDRLRIPWLVFAFVFLVIWTIVVVQIIWFSPSNHSPMILKMIFPVGGAAGLMFLTMFVYRYHAESKKRTRMTYAVTDKRILCLNDYFEPSFKSVLLGELDYVYAVERSDGKGGVVFDRKSLPQLNQGPTRSLLELCGVRERMFYFDLLENPAEVRDFIARAQRDISSVETRRTS